MSSTASESEHVQDKSEEGRCLFASVKESFEGDRETLPKRIQAPIL